MKPWWDKCNKWLYLGNGEGQNKPWIILLDNWLHWTPWNQLTTRQWNLFSITWNNGAWWGAEFDNAIVLDHKKHAKLECFFEVTIFGVGVRRQYSRKVLFDEEGFKEALRTMGDA
jgi:hypothetical protein